MNTQVVPAQPEAQLEIGGCTAITPRRGSMEQCGLTIVKNGLCKEHLERKQKYGV